MPKDDFRYPGIVFDVGTWRKANAIHRWFVDNVQDGTDDCKEYEVSREQLQELFKICVEILDKRDDKFSEEKLPPGEGFFFGGNDFDDYYYYCVERTLEILSTALSLPEDYDLSYSSSW